MMRADGIARRLAQFRIGMAIVLVRGFEFRAKHTFDRFPIAVECGERFIPGGRGDLGFPSGALDVFFDESRIVFQPPEGQR